MCRSVLITSRGRTTARRWVRPPPRQMRRNFQGYSTDRADALVAFGASAIGRLPQGFVQNASDIAGYTRAIEAGNLATVRGKALSPDDELRARIIARLMCDFTADLDDLAAHEPFAEA